MHAAIRASLTDDIAALNAHRVELEAARDELRDLVSEKADELASKRERLDDLAEGVEPTSWEYLIGDLPTKRGLRIEIDRVAAELSDAQIQLDEIIRELDDVQRDVDDKQRELDEAGINGW